MSTYGTGTYGGGTYGSPLGVVATTPTLVVEIAFATDPGAAPVWTDVTAYVQAFSTNRGRQSETDRYQAGTASLLLDNRDRRFDPAHAAGPYAGQVLPMRRARIRATWDGRGYPVFDGYVEAWPLTYPGPLDADVEVRLVDGFKILQMKELSQAFAGAASHLRIGAVLDAVGWGSGTGWTVGDATYGLLGTTTVLAPVGDRVIQPGQTAVIDATLAGTSALAHAQEVADAENGLLFVDAAGAVVFLGRHHAIRPPASTSRAVFGDRPASGELPYVDVALSYDDSRIRNEVHVTRTGGTTQTAANGPSISKYFARSLSKELPIYTDAEAADAAHWLLHRQREPAVRIESMELDGDGAPDTLWPQLLGRELADRVTVRRRPPGGGSALEQVSTLDGIAHRYTARGGVWDTTWRLSPADALTYWLVGDPAAAVLGTATRLAY